MNPVYSFGTQALELLKSIRMNILDIGPEDRTQLERESLRRIDDLFARMDEYLDDSELK